MNKRQHKIKESNMQFIIFIISIICLFWYVINVNLGGIDEIIQCKKIKGHICNDYELKEMRKENENKK